MWLSGLGVVPQGKMLPVDSGQGTGLGCRFVPGWGAYERQPISVSLLHGCFSPFLSLSITLSLISKQIKEVLKIFLKALYSVSDIQSSLLLLAVTSH